MDIIVERDVKDGEVAVPVSPGFGAGWSTWADDDYTEFCLFDKGLVALAAAHAGVTAVEEYITARFGEDAYICTLGWSQVKIVRLPEGTPFRINEYDGSESILTAEALYHIA